MRDRRHPCRLGAVRRPGAGTRGLTLRTADTAVHPVGFPITERHELPALLVAPETPASRLAVFCYPLAPAVVAGSTQPIDSLDIAAIASRRATLVRRRSGGGAVFVSPGAQVWLDLYVPAGDPLFSVDVIKASGFVAELWSAALTDVLGSEIPISSYSGPLVQSKWSRVWCYSGLGPGEVSRDRNKLVGLSQRRTRDGAWFFTMALCEFDADRDASFVATDARDRAALAEDLRSSLATLGTPAENVISRLKQGLAEL